MNARRDELAADIFRLAFDIDEGLYEHEAAELATRLAKAGWSKPLTVDAWTEWGVEHVLWPTSKNPKRVVVPANDRRVAENLAELGASEFIPPVVVSRTVSAGAWAPADPGGEG